MTHVSEQGHLSLFIPTQGGVDLFPFSFPNWSEMLVIIHGIIYHQILRTFRQLTGKFSCKRTNEPCHDDLLSYIPITFRNYQCMKSFILVIGF